MPKTIDPELLRKLASSPDNGIKEICLGLGMSDPTMYQQFAAHPELKQIYQEARAAARAAVDRPARRPAEKTIHESGELPAPAERRSAKKLAKKARKSVAPPRNGRAALDPELMRKVLFEFEFIELYNEFSDHFGEVKEQLAELT